MKPIYNPKGKAKEYGEYALNIYSGCPHRCWYCFAPGVIRKDRELFHTDIRPRDKIVEETRKQLEKEHINGKTIHLCFTCDPYPTGYDTTPTREIIKTLKEYGNHIQILTKGDGRRDLDLLEKDDWYGVSIDGQSTDICNRLIDCLASAKERGINTWVSFEPVLNPESVLEIVDKYHKIIDRAKFGKLNYHRSNINWKEFGTRIENECRRIGLDYYIKESLRIEMEQ